ncbi:MAG: alpha-glucan family phosphorylase, partial [Deltaproteobacteria bacterium]|nr:alpha-glucan family phosphorylase [Deltaproteobacteria bacterium]
MTIPIKILDVEPDIPKGLADLEELTNNLWFVWNWEAENLFRRINLELWETTRKNPVAFLSRMKQQDLKILAQDEGFIANLDRVKQEFNRYLSEKPNPEVFGKSGRPFMVAYFTAECGVADCLPIYSGGLGILSGDHLKSASDLNLPVVGVSLAYQKGYFRQYFIQDGWQMESYPVNLFNTMPMKRVQKEGGIPVQVSVDIKGENVVIQVWEVNIGRIHLYLLDTNVKENPDWARNITSELYGGDREMRIQQEIVL